jgi:hypothetical protein
MVLSRPRKDSRCRRSSPERAPQHRYRSVQIFDDKTPAGVSPGIEACPGFPPGNFRQSCSTRRCFGPSKSKVRPGNHDTRCDLRTREQGERHIQSDLRVAGNALNPARGPRMWRKRRDLLVGLLTNHISEQNPLSPLETLQVHLFERKEISRRRMHADAR